MILTDLFSMLLRLAELVFASIVAGITGKFLHDTHAASSMSVARFIYTEVLAGLSILLALFWLLPFASSFIHWPIDLVLSIAWFISFGLIVAWLNGSCGGAFDWSGLGVTGQSNCGTWKADVAFAFLSAIVWLVSAVLGLMWARKRRANATTGTTAKSGGRFGKGNRASHV